MWGRLLGYWVWKETQTRNIFNVNKYPIAISVLTRSVFRVSTYLPWIREVLASKESVAESQRANSDSNAKTNLSALFMIIISLLLYKNAVKAGLWQSKYTQKNLIWNLTFSFNTWFAFTSRVPYGITPYIKLYHLAHPICVILNKRLIKIKRLVIRFTSLVSAWNCQKEGDLLSRNTLPKVIMFNVIELMLLMLVP